MSQVSQTFPMQSWYFYIRGVQPFGHFKTCGLHSQVLKQPRLEAPFHIITLSTAALIACNRNCVVMQLCFAEFSPVFLDQIKALTSVLLLQTAVVIDLVPAAMLAARLVGLRALPGSSLCSAIAQISPTLRNSSLKTKQCLLQPYQVRLSRFSFFFYCFPICFYA